jgi:hypothetical protein
LACAVAVLYRVAGAVDLTLARTVTVAWLPAGTGPRRQTSTWAGIQLPWLGVTAVTRRCDEKTARRAEPVARVVAGLVMVNA